MKGFLGLTQFCSKFTAKLAEEIAPLLELKMKGVKWGCDPNHQEAFLKVKELFCAEALLHHPRRDRPYHLVSDASTVALGAFLHQRDDLGLARIVTMASRTLKGAEYNYFTTELELLAIVWALTKFRSFLLGTQVLIETDYKTLCYLLTGRFLNSRLTRWRLAIQDYDFKIKYMECSRNYIADALSHIPGKEIDNEQQNEASIAMILTRKPDTKLKEEIKDIRHAQRADTKINQLTDKIESGFPRREFTRRDNVLYKGKPGQEQIVLSRELMLKLIKETHEIYGHVGGLECFKLISEDFFYPKLKKHIARNVRTCISCQLNKSCTQNNRAISHPITPEGPEELVSIDFVGPMPVSRGGTRYLLVAMDAFSKYFQIYPIKKADTRTTIKKLFDNYIPKLGKPQAIQTDHGTQFTAKGWSTKLRENNITSTFSSIRHPQSNIVERVNKEIGRFFRTLISRNHKG